MRNCVALILAGAAWVGGMGGAGLRADDVADIIINEVMYNPASGDRQEDFIELFNQSATQGYNLLNFRFTSGVVFTFPSVTLGPGQYLVVCANQNRIRQIYGIPNTAGNWDSASTLDKRGEKNSAAAISPAWSATVTAAERAATGSAR